MPSSTYALSQNQVGEFKKNGHVLFRNIIGGKELLRVRNEIGKIISRHNSKSLKLTDRNTYGKAFLQTTNLWRKNAEVQEFVFARRFAQIAADLLEVEKVRLYHDQALFKEPGGGYTPWHRDKYYWPIEASKAVTMWMPLVDTSREMGLLVFASSSHLETVEELEPISDDSERFYEDYVAGQGLPLWNPESMKAGDATFHSGALLHKASGNSSDSITREVMTIIYFADGLLVHEPQNTNQSVDLEAWFPGCQPGDRAVSELNPILN